MMRVYVASSWRNEHYLRVVEVIRGRGHEVHDWRTTIVEDPERPGFRWSDIGDGWQHWQPHDYMWALRHPLAERGFANDMLGLMTAEAVVYLMPCGVSASLEAGWAKGKGRPVVCYVPALREPDLMVKMFDAVTDRLEDVLDFLERCEVDRSIFIASEDLRTDDEAAS